MPDEPWFKKPYPKGAAVGPAKLPRTLTPPRVAGTLASQPGPDVRAIKRAIIRAQRWDREFSEIDNVYYRRFAMGAGGGAVATSGLRGFQRQEGLAQTGILNDATYQRIRTSRIPIGPHKGEPLLDPYSRTLLVKAAEMFGTPAKVLAFYDWLAKLAANEPRVNYSQARPIQPLVAQEKPPKYPTSLDCSGSLIYVSWLAGLPSPDPNGYNGFGNTFSLRAKGVALPVPEAVRRASKQRVFAFYDDPDHVVAVLPDGRVWSHGREAGPQYEDGIFYRDAFLECRAYPN